jgi:CheY-like chemotaxis protein
LHTPLIFAPNQPWLTPGEVPRENHIGLPVFDCDPDPIFRDHANSSSVYYQPPTTHPPAFKKDPVMPKRGRKGKRRASGRRRILVVDDVADVTEMISLFLKHAGYHVATASSALDALRLAESKSFDMVISDIGMAQMNGYELAGELRALEKYKRVPMIAVTGYSEYDDRGRAVRAGFNVHLTKPIDPAGLLNLISELLN